MDKNIFVTYIDEINRKVSEAWFTDKNYFILESEMQVDYNYRMMKQNDENYMTKNPRPRYPLYSLVFAVICEIFLRVLDKIEIEKYSIYYANARSVIYDIWGIGKGETPIVPVEIEELYDFFMEHPDSMVKRYSDGQGTHFTKKYEIKGSPSGGTANCTVEFIKANEAFFSEIDQFTSKNHRYIPLLNVPILSQKFLHDKGRIASNKIGTYDFSKTQRKNFQIDIGYQAFIYRYCYKSSHVMGLDKIRKKQYWADMFSDTAFLNMLLKKIEVSAEGESETRESLRKIIEDTFFAQDMLKAYQNSEFPECFSIAYTYLFGDIVCFSRRRTKEEFLIYLGDIKNKIMDLMKLQLKSEFDEIVNDISNKMLSDKDNDINEIEKDLVCFLCSNSSYWWLEPTKKI